MRQSGWHTPQTAIAKAQFGAKTKAWLVVDSQLRISAERVANTMTAVWVSVKGIITFDFRHDPQVGPTVLLIYSSSSL